MSHCWLNRRVRLCEFINPNPAEALKVELVYQTLAPLPVFFEVECVEDELGIPQGVVRLLLGGKAHTLGHLCRVAARSLALDPHLQVHRCFLLALGPIMHRLGHIKALPAGFMNGDQPARAANKEASISGRVMRRCEGV